MKIAKLSFWLLLLVTRAAFAAPDKPNVIIVLTDDQDYGDIAAPIGKISIGTFGGAEGTVESMKAYKLRSIWPENVDTLTYSGRK